MHLSSNALEDDIVPLWVVFLSSCQPFCVKSDSFETNCGISIIWEGYKSDLDPHSIFERQPL